MQRNSAGQQESDGFSLLDIVKHAVRTIAAILLPGDRLSLITFANDSNIILPLTAMTDVGRQQTETALAQMDANGGTNIWAGLERGLQEFERQPVAVERVRAMVLLTDGQPNQGPSIGALQTLKKYKGRHAEHLPCVLYTFGFGYNLENPMLRDLATVGEGLYGFIPDASFVGTAFVNLICNLLVTTGTHVRLTIRTPLHIQTLQQPLHSWSEGNFNMTTIALGLLHADQPTVVLFTVTEATVLPNSVEVTLAYEAVGTGLVEVIFTGPQGLPPDPMFVLHYFRTTTVRTIYEAIALFQYDAVGAQDAVATLAREIGTHPQAPHQPRLQALLTDVAGQVTEAVATREAFNKWGRHYLLALADAHLYQQCTNFKDPGVQGYGGDYFRELRERSDSLFCSLPPPTRTCLAGARAASPPVNMQRYHQSSNPCFGGASLVQLADGTRKRVDRLLKDDWVMTPNGSATRVICVLKTECANQETLLCTLKGDLVITPYHPIRREGQWYFPSTLAPVQLLPCSAVYNFVLEKEHIMVINGVECVTLGHTFTADVVRHPYFGSAAVLDDLQMLPGWTKGFIELPPNCMQRTTKEGKSWVCGLTG